MNDRNDSGNGGSNEIIGERWTTSRAGLQSSQLKYGTESYLDNPRTTLGNTNTEHRFTSMRGKE
jgi:hypothetical protein